MRRTVALPAAVVAIVAICAGCGGESTLAPAPQVPELRIGMSVREAKQDLGPDFKLPYWNASVSPECNTFTLENEALRGLVISKRIATVAFAPEYDDEGNLVADSGAPTLRGLRADQPIGRAVELFGRPDRISSNESSGGEMVFWNLGEAEGQDVFLRANLWDAPGFANNAIDSLEVGVEPAIFYMEGCA